MNEKTVSCFPRLIEILGNMNYGFRHTSNPVIVVKHKAEIQPVDKDEPDGRLMLYLAVWIDDKEIFGQFQGFSGREPSMDIYKKIEDDIIAHMVSRGIQEVYNNMTQPKMKL